MREQIKDQIQKVEARNNKLITSFSTDQKNTPKSANTSVDKPVLHQTKFDFNTLESPERVAGAGVLPYKKHDSIIYQDFDNYLNKHQ